MRSVVDRTHSHLSERTSELSPRQVLVAQRFVRAVRVDLRDNGG